MSTKYERLANILRDSIPSLIRQGIHSLPTEAELCNRYHLSRETVRKALDLLIAEGIIYKIQGSGTFIKPNNLNGNKTDVALIVPSSSEYIYPTLLNDISLLLSRKGYSPYIYVTDYDMYTERRILASLNVNSLAGIIVEPIKSFLPTPNVDLFEKLDSSGIPILFIKGAYSNLSSIPFVRSDDIYGGYLACKRLLDNGHKKISFLFNRDSIEGIDRLSGALAAITDSSLSFEQDMITWYDDSALMHLRSNSNMNFITDFIYNKKADATACICQNDEIAYFLIQHLTLLGSNIPSDFSVISFDNSYLSDFGRIPITSLSHNKSEYEATICDSLIGLIKGDSITSSRLSWHIIPRRSDGFLPL